jgi:hypothetical protein
MERMIGHLGHLLRQPSNPFRNIAAQTKRVAATNALIAMWPDLERKKDDPRGSMDLGDNYLLLEPKDSSPCHLSPAEQTALDSYFIGIDHQSIYRWGRLQIPTEQIARSKWKEMERCSDMARTDRNVKVRDAIRF